MLIEKLKKEIVFQEDNRTISIFERFVFNKINELIDFINTREQDRSEQMARMIDKQMKNEKLQNERHQMMVISLAQHYQDKVELEKRISVLENATQPKEGERSTLGQFFYDLKQQEEESELLKCPHCNGIAYVCHNYDEGIKYQIKCKSNNCTGNFHTREYAIENWNKRA